MNMNWSERLKIVWNNIKISFNKCKQTILVLIIAVLAVFILIIWKKPAKTITITKDNLDLVRKVDSIRDVNGKYWAILKAQVVSEKEALMRNDSLSKALKLKPKFIKGQDIYISKSDTIFTELPVIVYRDGEGDTTHSISKKDDYIDIVATITKTTGSIEVKARDTLTRVESVRVPLIGKTTRKIYLHNASPYNSITEGMSFTVKEKEPFLTIGPYLGYDVLNLKPSFGISVQYPIIKFKR